MSPLEQELERLRGLCEIALQALLPIIPMEGEWPDYRPSRRDVQVVRALPEEWLEAAEAVAALGTAVTREPVA